MYNQFPSGVKRARDSAASTIARAVRKSDFFIRRKKSRNSALTRHVRMPIHCMERTCQLNLGLHSLGGFSGSPLAVSTPGGIGLGFQFSLQGMTVFFNSGGSTIALLPDIAEFTTLFDMYRIDSVNLTMNFTSDGMTVTATPALTCPNILSLQDFDDAVAPFLNDALQYGSCKPNYFNASTGIKKRTVYPKCAIAVYKTSTTMGTVAKAGQFIDCVDTTVPQYGLKMCYDGGSQRSTTDAYIGCFQITAKFNLSFKTTR